MTREELETCHQNPRHWKWGAVYYCPLDPRRIVPKRVKWMGWIFNAAHPGSILVVLQLIALMIVPPGVAAALGAGIGLVLATVATIITAVCLICAPSPPARYKFHFEPIRGCSESDLVKVRNCWGNWVFWVRLIFQREVPIPTGAAANRPATHFLAADPARPSCGATPHCRLQTHLPSQAQAVEKHLAQTQLVFLKGLGWFNPRPDLP
jgi:hypothetical protein